MRLHSDVTIHPTRSGGISLRRGSRRVPAPHLNAHEIELVRIWCGESRPASDALVKTILATGMCVTGFEQFVMQCEESGLIQTEVRPVRHEVRNRADQPLRLLSTVGIMGLDSIGIGIALGLAQSGVGHLRLQDRAPITSADTRLGWYRLDELGARRELRAANHIRAVLSDTQITTGDLEGCDLIVIVGPSAVAAHSSAAIISDGVLHFAVCADAGIVDVGPVVIPGKTACLHCIDLHRAEVRFETNQVGLAEKWGRQTSAAESGSQPGISMILTAVAHGVSMALRTIDDSPPPHMVTAASPDYEIQHHRWGPHDDCGCMEFAPAGRALANLGEAG